MTTLVMLQQLKRIRSSATMEQAWFRIGDQPAPFGAECTDLVRVATRMWRYAWIISPLDEIIAELEKKVS